jgi:diacylglycerol diphosphate phosphatase/phosphatidate phosphatase
MTLQGIKSDCLASWRFPSRVYWAQYALDFLFMIACFAITGGVNGYVKPFHRDFDPTDPSLNYPMHPDSVSYGVMTGVMIAVSFVVFVVAQIRVRSTIDLHFAIFGLAQALSITLMITEVVKVIAGRFRPDWIARCIPDADKNCTNTDESVVNDGRMSFFSGHTSTAFVLMTFLALYVSGKIRPLQAGGHFYRFIICIAPVCAATWVGISRTMDNRHHFDDVLTGAAVGILSPVLSTSNISPILSSVMLAALTVLINTMQ